MWGEFRQLMQQHPASPPTPPPQSKPPLHFHGLRGVAVSAKETSKIAGWHREGLERGEKQRPKPRESPLSSPPEHTWCPGLEKDRLSLSPSPPSRLFPTESCLSLTSGSGNGTGSRGAGAALPSSLLGGWQGNIYVGIRGMRFLLQSGMQP